MQKKSSKDSDILIGRKALIRKNENINENYMVSAKPIGKGSYGAVHACVHKITKQTRAVKIISKYKMTNVDAFLNEIELLRLVVFYFIFELYKGSPKYNKTV